MWFDFGDGLCAIGLFSQHGTIKAMRVCVASAPRWPFVEENFATVLPRVQPGTVACLVALGLQLLGKLPVPALTHFQLLSTEINPRIVIYFS